MYYVYWIVSKNKCYIGATVDPIRRLKQHNGELVGGAYRTHNNGPWSYYCVISGFRTWNEALSFEWAFKYHTKKCRCTKSRDFALKQLLERERWTKNSPPSSDIVLNVQYLPFEYGEPPENYTFTNKKNKTKHKNKLFKNIYGVTY